LQNEAEKRAVDGRVLSGRSREPQEMQAAWGVREGALRAAFPVEQSRYMIQKGFVGHAFLLVACLAQEPYRLVRNFLLPEDQTRNPVNQERMDAPAALRSV
jgi:hypothetical protein